MNAAKPLLKVIIRTWMEYYVRILIMNEANTGVLYELDGVRTWTPGVHQEYI
jgi:hypothetical protein